MLCPCTLSAAQKAALLEHSSTQREHAHAQGRQEQPSPFGSRRLAAAGSVAKDLLYAKLSRMKNVKRFLERCVVVAAVEKYSLPSSEFKVREVSLIRNMASVEP